MARPRTVDATDPTPSHRPGARQAVAVVIVLMAGLLAACGTSRGQQTPARTPSASPSVPSSRSATAPPATPSVAATPDPAQLRAQATTAVQALIAGQPGGGVSVAAMNTATGASFSAGATSGMWTASAYKLFVLEALLLQRQGDGGLTDSEADQAIPMIEQSDNVAGYALFEDAGGRPGLATAIGQLGLTHTVPGISDPTFTTTSGSDCVALLRNLVAAKGPLDAASQAYALNLMRSVEADQRWGVGAVAQAGTTFANKNGWLSVDNTNGPTEDDNGLWAVTSLGIVTVHGQQVLMAVLTRHQPSMAAGVSLVESLAKAMAPAVAY
jgi:beta-lactamase class A